MSPTFKPGDRVTLSGIHKPATVVAGQTRYGGVRVRPDRPLSAEVEEWTHEMVRLLSPIQDLGALAQPPQPPRAWGRVERAGSPRES